MNDAYYALRISHLSTGARLIDGRIAGLDLHPLTDAEHARGVRHAEDNGGIDIIHMEIEESGGPIGDGMCLSFRADFKRDLLDPYTGKGHALASVWLDVTHVRMLHAALGAVLKMHTTMAECTEDNE